MQQFPNNQHSFYNNPTQYNHPVPPPLPQSPAKMPLPHERALTWFKARNKFVQIGTGCLLLVILTMCGICTAVSQAANNSSHPVTTSPTRAPQHAIATATLEKPTPTPQPTPTPAPVATTAPAPASAPVATDTPAPAPSCYPLTNSGNCYEPGEYCRTSDHEISGTAGDGTSIKCTYNGGWRWEPSN